MNYNEHNMVEKKEASSAAPDCSEKKRGKRHRLLRIAAWTLAGTLGGLIAVGGGGLMFLNSSAGEAWITRTINDALNSMPSGLSCRVDSFHGSLPFSVILDGITFKDTRGVWLQAENAELRLDWTSLPKTFTVAKLSLENPRVLRLPETLPSKSEEPEQMDSFSAEELTDQIKKCFQNWPGWLPSLLLDKLSVSHAVLSKSVIGLPLVASLDGHISLGNEGAELSLNLKRDDLSCVPVALHSTLSSALELSFTVTGSDLGFAELLPQTAGEHVNGVFHLAGNGNPQLLQTELTADLHATESRKNMLSASGTVDFRFIDSASGQPRATGTLTLESGPAATGLWAIAGQKNGKLKTSLQVQAFQHTATEINFSTSVELSEMDWTDSLMVSLLGSDCSLRGNGKIRMGGSLGMEAELQNLTLQAEQLHALVNGRIQIPNSVILSPETHILLHSECNFDNTGKLSPALSGNARFIGDISGPLTELDTTLTLISDRLNVDGTLIEKANAELILPKADVTSLIEELPKLTDYLQKSPSKTAEGNNSFPEKNLSLSPLLTGRARATLHLNGQQTDLETSWNLEEKHSETDKFLCLALNELELHLEDSSLSGNILAQLPLGHPVASPGVMENILGITPPLLDGSLTLHIPRWTPVARISGLNLSGSPLKLHLALSSSEKQTVRWQGNLANFRIRSSQGEFSLKGMKTEIDIKNLWNKPKFTATAGLASVKTPSVALSHFKIDITGNQKAVQGSLQSQGDIHCNTFIHWKPGEWILDKLDVELVPAVLGLEGNVPAGIRLNTPSVIRCKGDTISIPEVDLAVFPSGQINLSGTYATRHTDLSASISSLDLARLRPLLPEIPSGTATCRIHMSGTLSRPKGNLKLNFKDIQFPGSSLPPVSAEITGQVGVSGKTRQLDLVLVVPEETQKALGISTCHMLLSVPLTSPGQGVALPDFKRPLHGEVILVGELGQIWKLLPLADQRLSGQINLTSELSGTLFAPELTIHTSLDNGRFADLAQGVELRDIRLRLDTDKLNIVRKSGDRLTLELSAGDGRKGTVSITGWLNPENLQLFVNGEIKHLSPLRRQDVNVMLSGALGADGTASEPHIKADITVEKGQIQLADLPGSDIVTLPIEEPGQNVPPPPKKLSGAMDIHVRIPNQFFIRGYGLECEWKGDIRARGPFTKPGITGGIQAVRGGLDILGKHFKLTEGRISFDGGWPISPMLNIIMEYTASSLTADVTVSGSAEKPEISLSSQPAMPQDEIISQVMFGQSAGTLSHVQAIQLAAGAAQLAGLGGPDVMGFGRKLLGLDVFKLNSESTSSDDGNSDMSKTSLEMGTYVLDNVYVGVEQGIGRESETDAVVEIELTPSLEAQAKASSNRTEFGLEWKKNY